MGNDSQNVLYRPDGRILGKMAHSGCTGNYVLQKLPGHMDQKIFESGVRYFK